MINNLWSDREAVFPPCNRRASVPLSPNITTTHRRVFEHQYSIFTTVSRREYIERQTIVTQRRSNHKSAKITGSFEPQDWGYQPCKAQGSFVWAACFGSSSIHSFKVINIHNTSPRKCNRWVRHVTVLCFDPAFVSNTNFRQLIVVDMVLIMVVTVCGD